MGEEETKRRPTLPRISVISQACSTDESPEVTSLQAAMLNFDLNRIEELILGGLDVTQTYIDSRQYRTALHELALCYTSYSIDERPAQLNLKFIKIFSLLTKHGLKVNEGDIKKQTVLHFLSSTPGNSDVIKVVLAAADMRVDATDAIQQTALHKAALNGGVADVQTLLDGGANPRVMDGRGYTPVHMAAKKKYNREMLATLVNGRGDVNQQAQGRNMRGPTALHVAAAAGRLENVETLLEFGAKTDYVDGAGQTALHAAAYHDVTGKIVAVLVAAGAKVDAQDELCRDTPLHKAIKRGMVDNVKHLMHSKANPNIQDAQSDTPLHKAAATCFDLFVWTKLMRGGGRPDMKNRNGLTPMNIASNSDNHTATAVMTQYEVM